MMSGALVVVLALAAAVAVPAQAQAAPGSTWRWVQVDLTDRVYLIFAMLPEDLHAGDCTMHTDVVEIWKSTALWVWEPLDKGYSEWSFVSKTSTNANSDDIWWSQFEFWSDNALVAKTAEHQGPTMTERGQVVEGHIDGKLPMSQSAWESIRWIRWLGRC
jgi:hypothetical protein